MVIENQKGNQIQTLSKKFCLLLNWFELMTNSKKCGTTIQMKPMTVQVCTYVVIISNDKPHKIIFCNFVGVNNFHDSVTNYVVINGVLTEDRNDTGKLSSFFKCLVSFLTFFTEDLYNISDSSNLDHHETSTITMSTTNSINSQIGKQMQAYFPFIVIINTGLSESEPTTTSVYGVMIEIREMFKEIKTYLLNFPNCPTTSRMSFESTPKQPYKKYAKLMKYENILMDNADAQNQLVINTYIYIFLFNVSNCACRKQCFISLEDQMPKK